MQSVQEGAQGARKTRKPIEAPEPEKSLRTFRQTRRRFIEHSADASRSMLPDCHAISKKHRATCVTKEMSRQPITTNGPATNLPDC